MGGVKWSGGGRMLREAVLGTYKQRPLRYSSPAQRPKCSQERESESEREKVALAPTCGTRTALCYHAGPQKLGPLQANNHRGGDLSPDACMRLSRRRIWTHSLA